MMKHFHQLLEFKVFDSYYIIIWKSIKCKYIICPITVKLFIKHWMKRGDIWQPYIIEILIWSVEKRSLFKEIPIFQLKWLECWIQKSSAYPNIYLKFLEFKDLGMKKLNIIALQVLLDKLSTSSAFGSNLYNFHFFIFI